MIFLNQHSYTSKSSSVDAVILEYRCLHQCSLFWFPNQYKIYGHKHFYTSTTASTQRGFCRFNYTSKEGSLGVKYISRANCNSLLFLILQIVTSGYMVQPTKEKETKKIHYSSVSSNASPTLLSWSISKAKST